jgi:hypothetical protein
MNTTPSFNRGATAGALLVIGADALHWFIDPVSAGATTARTVVVTIVAVVCIGIAGWLTIRERRRTAPTT